MSDATAAHNQRSTKPVDATKLVDKEGLRSGVSRRLEALLDEQATLLESFGQDTHLLIEAWRTLLSGGKRLRPAFAYWGYRAAQDHNASVDKDAFESLLRVGASLELFQAAALFHDDVMDRSDTRRGFPTAHKTFESLHRTSQFVGDPENYGTSVAILLGDLSLVACENEFRKAIARFGVEERERAHDYFDTMRTTVTVGQFLDVHAQVAPWDIDLKTASTRAFNIIKTKTASYSVVYPLLIGASLAGASPDTLRQLNDFARPIGIAYQLLDDLLGTFGDPQTTGKPAGDDLREGKRTALVVDALDHLDHTDAQFLKTHLGTAELDDSHIASMLKLIEKSGAVARIQNMVNDLAHHASEQLENSLLNPVGKDTLRDLANYALTRTF